MGISLTVQAARHKPTSDDDIFFRKKEISQLYHLLDDVHWSYPSQYDSLLNRFLYVARETRNDTMLIDYYLYCSRKDIDLKRGGSSLANIEQALNIAIRLKNRPRALECFLTLEATYSDFNDYKNVYRQYLLAKPYLNYLVVELINSPGNEAMGHSLAAIYLSAAHSLTVVKDSVQLKYCVEQLNRINKYFAGDTTIAAGEVRLAYYLAANFYLIGNKQPDSANKLINKAMNIIDKEPLASSYRAKLLLYQALVKNELVMKDTIAAQHYYEGMKTILSAIPTWLELRMAQDQYAAFFYAYNKKYNLAYQKMADAFGRNDSLLERVLEDRANNIKAEVDLLKTNKKLYEAELAKQRSSQMLALSLLALLSLGLGAMLVVNRIRFANKQKLNIAKLELAANLHDDLGPLLYYVRMLVSKHNKNEKPDINVCAEVEQNLGIAIESMRNISQELSSQETFYLSSLVDVIKGHFNKLGQHIGISGHLYYELNGKERIPEFRYNHVLRIVNELINNSLKHANPNHIFIYIQNAAEPGNILLIYYDDGPGWPEAAEPYEGRGMKNLKRRCELIKADLTIRNNYPEGYRININFPL